MDKPLMIDLFAGLGGWSDGGLAEGYKVVGFDIEAHDYGDGRRYPAQLVIQDVMTIHGSQFKDAALIVASPPCQEYSYMAMPWSRAKTIAAEYRNGTRDVAKLTALFDACFRIQREAIEAAGHFIPMVVENVRGAQPWVGKARWNFGSYYLWGDVPALMPITMPRRKVANFRFDGSGRSFQTAAVNEHIKNNGGSWFNIGSPGQKEVNRNPVHELASTGFKTQGMNWSDRSIKGQDFTRIAGQQAEGVKTVGHANRRDGHSHTRHLTNQAESEGVKGVGLGSISWGQGKGNRHPNDPRNTWSKANARKAASAAIAKIPMALARWIAKVYKPRPA
jgi:hypothetical protein